MARSSKLRLLGTSYVETGGSPSEELDLTSTLEGFDDSTVRVLTLAPAASNQAVTFTGAARLLIVTRDYPFQLRLAAGETLIPNLRAFLVEGHTIADGATVETSVLLTGNGENLANLEVRIIEAPT